MTNRQLTLAAAALVALSHVAGAQVNSMVGTVRDSIGRPIPDAELIVGASTARTDTLGRYYISFPRSDSVTVQVRRMGFEQITFTVSAAYVAQNSVEVRMRAVAQALATVEVTTRELRSRTLMEGFDYRRTRGNGIYLTAEEIAARGSQQLSNILRGQRGLEFVRGRMGRQSLRFAQYRGKNCEPLIWLDGRLTRNMEIDDFPATEIEGIELYDGPSTTPGEFIRGPNVFCGAIVLWSKVPMLQRPPSR